MDMDYKIVAKFKVSGIEMIVVKLLTGTHVMSAKEWKQIKHLYKKQFKQKRYKVA